MACHKEAMTCKKLPLGWQWTTRPVTWVSIAANGGRQLLLTLNIPLLPILVKINIKTGNEQNKRRQSEQSNEQRKKADATGGLFVFLNSGEILDQNLVGCCFCWPLSVDVSVSCQIKLSLSRRSASLSRDHLKCVWVTRWCLTVHTWRSLAFLNTLQFSALCALSFCDFIYPITCFAKFWKYLNPYSTWVSGAWGVQLSSRWRYKEFYSFCFISKNSILTTNMKSQSPNI